MGVDLESSVKLQGKWVTKIIHFVGGEKKTKQRDITLWKIYRGWRAFDNNSQQHYYKFAAVGNGWLFV